MNGGSAAHDCRTTLTAVDRLISELTASIHTRDSVFQDPMCAHEASADDRMLTQATSARRENR